MSTKLTVRLNERSTYEVHIEQGNPPQNFTGGLSLDLDRLKTELGQHGCSQELIAEALQQVGQQGSATVSL